MYSLSGLHRVTNGEASAYVDTWFNGDHHARGERCIVIYQWAVMDVHSKIVTNVMREEGIDNLEKGKRKGEGKGGEEKEGKYRMTILKTKY